MFALPRNETNHRFRVHAAVMSFIIIFAVLTSGLAGAHSAPTPLRAQPILLELAQSHPHDQVQVIVQKTDKDTAAEQFLKSLGGKVLDDLPIIRAFSAVIPAQVLPKLAAHPGVHWVSLDAPMIKTGCTSCISTTNLKNAYIRTIGADRLWNEAPYLQGQNVGVAVVDSGVNPQQDLYTPLGTNRIVASVAFNDDYNRTIFDGYGHGSHVAGIIGGNGSRSFGGYVGVARKVNIINVKVSNDNGGSTASNVVKGLQWINDNRAQYNIRVVNMSLNSAVPESYNTSPINAAAEILWFNKVVVVVSVGNNGKNALYPPANDPFVISVGATDDRGTASLSDDVIASYSGSGKTTDGFTKPELVAPGTNIVSLMANTNSILALSYPSHIVNLSYFRMSGTSMAAPMVSGAAALLLQDEPMLTPDQIKYRLMATARPFDSPSRAGAGYLDVYAAVHGTTTQSANVGISVSRLLTTGSAPMSSTSTSWNSVNWNSVNWNSVNWNSVNWNSVNWNSDSMDN